jgi:hypothetical protein
MFLQEKTPYTCKTADPGGLAVQCMRIGLLIMLCLMLSSCWADSGRTSRMNPLETALPVEITNAQAVLDSGLVDRLSYLPRYAIALEIQPNTLSYTGQMTLTYTNTAQIPLEDGLFRLLPNAGQSFGPGQLEVSALTVDQIPAAYQLENDPSLLRVLFPEPLPPGSSIQFSMNFAGKVPQDFGGENTYAYGIFNFTQQVLSLSSWYPILAVLEGSTWRADTITPIGDAVFSEMAFYSVKITSPLDWQIVATGVMVSEQTVGDQIDRLYLSGPVRDFYLTASPDFNRLSKKVDGVLINAYGLPGSEPGNQAALDVAAASLEIFSGRFGAYPYTELDIVQVPMRNAGGVEFPGIVLIESGRYAEPEGTFFITTVSHEVAHQWWYNVVGNDVFLEPWLDEALTTYSSALYWESLYGEPAYQEVVAYWQSRVQELRNEGKDIPIAQSLAYFMRSDPYQYGPVVYNKGALFFHELRQEIGDQAFFSALKTYYQDYSFRIAHGEDLLDIFEVAADRNLDNLYQQWLYGP